MATIGTQTAGRAKAVRHREAIDWSRREPVTSTVLTAVQSVDGRSPRELAPLARYVDPDALETLFGSNGDKAAHFSFEYDGYTVHIDGAGHVSVC
jgi:hypothetical protein